MYNRYMEKLFIIDKWGKKRKAAGGKCPTCLRDFVRRVYTNRPNIFCSITCAIKSREGKLITKLCAQCNCEVKIKEFRSKSISFCSQNCQNKFQSGDRHPNWKGGKSSYSDRAFRFYGRLCMSGENCLLKSIVLKDYHFDVDHIDGDRTNNKIENLQVLCVLCHREKTAKTWACNSVEE